MSILDPYRSEGSLPHHVKDILKQTPELWPALQEVFFNEDEQERYLALNALASCASFKTMDNLVPKIEQPAQISTVVESLVNRGFSGNEIHMLVSYQLTSTPPPSRVIERALFFLWNNPL